MSVFQHSASRVSGAGLLYAALMYFILSLSANAQQVQVHGGFLGDSINIGEPTPYFLAARYPKSLNILFPDSTFGFAPFEFSSKKYFATETRDSISTDSAVYYLSTFEVDEVLRLGLPVFQVNPQDCTEYRAAVDSIFLIQMVTQSLDSIPLDKLPLKENLAHEDVPYTFNYFIAGLVVWALVVIGSLVWGVFGKKIARSFRAKRLQRRHDEFIRHYTTSVEQLRASFSRITAESALTLWKKYMEELEKGPYTKLTTRELAARERDEALARSLRSIDTAIYGHNTSVLDSLQHLKHFSDQRLAKKLTEVKYGK